MSSTLTDTWTAPAVEVRADAPEVRPTPLEKLGTSTRKWAVTACVFLALSGAYRVIRDYQFSGKAQSSKQCPFPLSEIPKVMGKWKIVENSESKLDPETARLAGSSDHILRNYVNTSTGEEVAVLVLYGLADSVFGHTPEICYKAAGFRVVSPTENHEFKLNDSSPPIRYASGFFSKNSIEGTHYTEVLWSFWHAGSWWTDVASRWKQFRYSPGMFKIQLQRPTKALSGDDSPSEPLLREIVREINSRLDHEKTASIAKSG